MSQTIDAAHLAHQREWSERTFGPGPRTKGVLDHIRKELKEIEDDPADVKEWVDVVILALDGAWRAGWEPQEIIDAIKAKQARNEARTWPDWRAMSEDQAIEHDRSDEPAAERDVALVRLAFRYVDDFRVCELVAGNGNVGRCQGKPVAVRLEDGFPDAVCDEHGRSAERRGARVIWTHEASTSGADRG
jgi:hypothetical protein